VRGDAARLRQVLNNLLGNAVKFTHRGRITLLAGPGSEAGRVRLAVSDTGEGIGAAELARIFQPFHQSPPAAPPATPATLASRAAQGGRPRATDGVGLGLTIAREIALAMGSDIVVRSEPGEGSEFSFEAILPAVAPGLRMPRLVLVAEDDEVNTLIVGAYLDSLGVRHERVPDGKQAVSRALRETDRPDLVLLDCRMPVMDGLAATADIRRQERTLGLPRMPVVALTATASEADRAACLGAGMDAVMAKPFTLAQLAETLRDAGRLA
jgi:CheY-like chemotaxis protein